ncbi:hypothetical protein Indivirus_12_10 [Indivirus ILV1]|uniref:Uncharacterized protein n=1 Tax=Indivirus ILV1 TaxID=1977633 RepID=A0A1V0SEE3_9VIRU|nr:hypothetical protein Indivirus_12_10 [Indivirus ILV1]
MKYYLVYLLNYKEFDSVVLKDMYRERDDAIKSLERNAINYIKELQGKQQADICKQDKAVEEILADSKLKEGLYIIKDGDAVILYEKTTVVKVGNLWNSRSLKMIKAGKFYITEYNFDESLFQCNRIVSQISSVKFDKPKSELSFIDELKSLNGKFNLKPIKNSKISGTITTKTSFSELCDTVNNF